MHAVVQALVDAGWVYILVGAIIGALLAALLVFLMARRAARWGRAPPPPTDTKAVKNDPEQGPLGYSPQAYFVKGPTGGERDYISRNSFNTKELRDKADVLPPADSTASTMIGVGANPMSSTARPTLSLSPVNEPEQEGDRAATTIGVAAMRTLSLNRMLSLIPSSPRMGHAGYKDSGDYASTPKPRPKSNLAREVMEKQGSLARTFSSLWAKMHRAPLQEAPTLPDTPHTQSSFAIAANLAGTQSFSRAGAVHAASSEDREPSNANSMAESIDKKPWFPDQNTERSWALESNPSGMPRIVVRRSTTPSARNTAEAYPSSIAAMSTEGARGLRRRSSRASRVSDDSKLGLGTGSGSLPVSVGAAGLRGSKSFAEDQLKHNALFEEVDLAEQAGGLQEDSDSRNASALRDAASLHTNPLVDSRSEDGSGATPVNTAYQPVHRPKAAWSRGPGGKWMASDTPGSRGSGGSGQASSDLEEVDLTAPGEQQLRIIPPTLMRQMQGQAQMMLVLRVEEVLPRPGAGLLHRMLRLAPVDLVASPDLPQPVLVLRPNTHYQISVRIYQALARQAIQISKCRVRLVSTDGVGTLLNLDSESEGGDDGVWRASTTWDPETSNLPDLETDATGPIDPAPMDVQFELACQTQREGPVRYCATALVHVKQVRRGAPSQLEEYDMSETWDSASDVLLAWQHSNVEWEGADFPLLLHGAKA